MDKFVENPKQRFTVIRVVPFAGKLSVENVFVADHIACFRSEASQASGIPIEALGDAGQGAMVVGVVGNFTEHVLYSLPFYL